MNKPLTALKIGLFLSLGLSFPIQVFAQHSSFEPGARSMMDAHNCYPYFEWWADRIDRALSLGTPLAIEQDPFWYTDPHTGRSWSVVAHGAPVTGHEPTLEQYFFERIRPIVEDALRRGNRADWPLITLNLDFKTEEPEHLAAVWALLNKYRDWITTALTSSDRQRVEPDCINTVLVVTGEPGYQEQVC